MPDSGPPSAHMLLSGWGRYPVVESLAYRPEKHADLMAAATLSDAGPVLARGWGRSYGDAALNRRGATILTERLNRMLQFDEDAGVLTCEAGLSLDAILHTFIPRGYF